MNCCFPRSCARGAAFAAAGLLLAVPSVLACRMIMPPPHHPIVIMPERPPPPREMEVKSHKASMVIDNKVAKITVNAVFHNPNPQRIEGIYWFPIGQNAAVSSFAMTVNGKTMEAELLDAGKATQIYEDIVRQQKDPALLEYVGQGMLKARVFPIEPNADVAIELSYDQQVRRDGALARVSYPLLSAKPGSDQAIKSLVVDVDLKVKGTLKSVFTPGFEAAVKRGEGAQARLTFEKNSYVPDKDFEVVFSDSGDKVGMDFLGYKKGDEGYFMLCLAPASELQAEEIAAKDLLFVIDTSGSMAGERIKQAQEALKFCINSLSARDHFNLAAFATDVNPLADATLPATEENRKKALAFVDEMKARGGTAIDDAVAFALNAKRAPGAVPMTVFMTDGLPTIGEIEPDAILKRFAGLKTPVRFFTFGVGHDVNTRLLDAVARDTRGYASYVRPGENLEVALSGFYERVASPVMTDLKLDTGDLRLSELNPVVMPDLFKGAQLVITGRYTGKGEAKIKLSGDIGGKRENFAFTANLDGDARNAFVPRLWASQRVAYLVDQVRGNAKNTEVIDEIKRLGRQYGIVTPYTSFLVVEEGLKRETVQAARRAMDKLAERADADHGAMAVENSIALGRAKGGPGGGAAPAAPAAAGEGFWAQAAREELKLSDAEMKQLVVSAGDKTFYLRQQDGFLWDSDVPAGQFPAADVEVKAWSAEFFKLLKEQPALRPYLKVGVKLVIKLGGKLYKFTE